MPSLTKNQKIEALVKLVQKRCRGAGLTAPPQRTVLETLMYAALLENATFDQADLAYTVLENYYIDWNEIRVCSVRELADTLTDLPNPEAAAERIRKSLQGIFEKTYMFDLEDVRKKGKALAEHIKTLESMSAGTPYMIQYVAQVALDGHLIPFDEASMRIMRRLGLSQISNDGTKEVCIGLDRVILKKSSLTFAAQLHHFAAGYYDVPDSPELLSQLSAIDSEVVNRNWGSSLLAVAVSSSAQSAVPLVSEPDPLPNKPQTPQALKEPPKATPVTPPVTKPAKKPMAKSSPAKPVAVGMKKKPLKSATVAKRTPPKISKTPPNKPSKKVLPKKPTKPTKSKKPVKPVKLSRPTKPVKSAKSIKSVKPTKPALPKKKPAVKKSQTKPVKKAKTITPSKALRKKKPK